MRLLLFDDIKIYKLELPDVYEGSYQLKTGFDGDGLTAISPRDNKWFMKSNHGVVIKYNGQPVDEVELFLGGFYTITAFDKNYILYVEKSYDNSYQLYSIDGDCDFTLGNNSNDSIYYNVSSIASQKVSINYAGGIFRLVVDQGTYVYRNDTLISDKQIVINSGDAFFFYGLRFVFTNNCILINNPMNNVSINFSKFKSVSIPIRRYEKIEKEINHKNLYSEKDYFYKTPRIRRYIETYEMAFASPPNKRDEEDMPLLLTIGPMLTMGLVSGVTLGDVIYKLYTNQTTIDKSWMRIVTAIISLVSMLLWPMLTKKFQKRRRERYEKKRIEKYGKYVEKKKRELSGVITNQTNILNEKILSVNDCIDIINNKSILLWNRQNSQADFLTARIGRGNIPLDININFQEDEFSMDEDDLLEKAKDTIERASVLVNVPIAYSFKDNKVSAILGIKNKKISFLKNLLFQLVTFHGYDDLKLVFMLDENSSGNWTDFKDIPHVFSNDYSVRFFADNFEEMKTLDMFLQKIFVERATDEKNRAMVETEDGSINFKPYYLIVTDDFEHVRKLGITDLILKNKPNFGFAFIILEDTLGKIPSECIDFINIGVNKSETLKNTSEEYIVQEFKEEINEYIDYPKYFEKLFNIPIEVEEEGAGIPTSLSFLEMFKIGRVEQLNSLTRWKLNDPTQSLRALIGVNEGENRVYLDLHEKAHGPHGLIAGTTGSGKSEFIITYVLSMALNYSPEEVSFILIDYKGGGLAGAFDNKALGVRLPHLAGVITNLDKAELNRTLISINSELTRRQILFNQARDKLGESTVDIYKYQKFYREGKLDKPISHLFIISDEFAELKSQQPEFMDDLVSAARIGRSLGVHLILATQKPSGVVNDQIWSNSKFKICLKVQDRGDSNEMLKRPDAAEIKNPGRFYLQVGYDELFLLAQSGYAGIPYHPSDFIVNDSDDSVVFIDNTGQIIKEVTPSKEVVSTDSVGDQLSNVLRYITNLATKQNLKADALWLPNIPESIYVDDLIKKYNYSSDVVTAIVGEYDDPANQRQNILTIKIDETANTLIYGRNSSDREMFLNSFVYSLCENYGPEQVNIYIMDFGNETLRMFSPLAQVGDVVLSSDVDKVNKAFSVINDLIIERKQLFSDYNGDYFNYIRNSGKKLPIVIFIINNYDSFVENFKGYDDTIIRYAREGKRYGISLVMSASSGRTMFNRLTRNFDNVFALEMNDKGDYVDLFGKIGKLYPSDYPGRGICKVDGPVEFQTSKIFDGDDVVGFIKQLGEKQKTMYDVVAPPIPVLPDKVTVSSLAHDLKGLSNVPFGLIKSSLKPAIYDFGKDKINLISSIEFEPIVPFVESLITMVKEIENLKIILLDFNKMFESMIDCVTGYLDKNFSGSCSDLEQFIDKNIVNTDNQLLFIFAGTEKLFISENNDALDKFIKKMSLIDNINIIIADSYYQFKELSSRSWYISLVRNNNAIWIGSGITDQGIIKVSDMNRNHNAKIGDNFSWYVRRGQSTLVKLMEMDKDEE